MTNAAIEDENAATDLSKRHAVVVFDGVCNFCNGSINLLMKLDRARRFSFAASQSKAGERLLRQFGIDPFELKSVYLVADEKIWSRSDAVLQMARRLGFPWRMATVFRVVPRPIRDWVYELIARNRYRVFGRSESCRIPTAEERSRFLA